MFGIPGNNASRPFADEFALALQDATEDDGDGQRCELKTYEYRYNSHGDRVMLEAGAKSKLRSTVEGSREAALVLVKSYDRDLKITSRELRIRSPHIKRALREVIKSYPGLNFNSSTVTITDTPKCLFHYRTELAQYAAKLSKYTVAAEHIALIMEYMQHMLATEIVHYDTWMTAFDPSIPPGLEFQHLWMAFKPGELLYHSNGDSREILRLDSVYYPNRRREFVIDAHGLDFDGQDFGHRSRTLSIRRFENYMPFTLLKVYPLQYHAQHDDVKNAMIARGRKFIQLSGVHFRKYTGCASPKYGAHFKVNGRIVIDPASYYASQGARQPEFIEERRIFRTEYNDQVFIDDETCALCAPVLPGFCLKEKRWAYFRVDGVSEIKFDPTPFEQLILPPSQKSVLCSLVESHCGGRTSFDDIVVGKGKGMVILLYGSVGSGKTVTAESLAERTKCLLYVVSCADLGVDFHNVEEKLLAVMQRSVTWNAIVLIDEADVFLEQRTASDLERNALVSVFLRVLEYFEGILFLTTNRVRNFDEAFRSRIHMAIKYTDLTFESRRELWTTFVTNAHDGSRPDWLLESTDGLTYLDKIAREDLNGRQIKNAARLAHALASADGSDVYPAHIEKALEHTRAFSAALKGERRAKASTKPKLPLAPQRKRQRARRLELERKRRRVEYGQTRRSDDEESSDEPPDEEGWDSDEDELMEEFDDEPIESPSEEEEEEDEDDEG